jgi:hypothetical protein
MCMVFGLIEIGTIIIAGIVAILLFKVMNSFVHLAIHAVIGAVILLAAKFLLGYQIAFSWLVIVIIALGGSVGAIIIIILHVLKIAFLT